MSIAVYSHFLHGQKVLQFNMKQIFLQVITATGSQVTLADQMASNGVIHVVDRVMFPAPTETVTGLVKSLPTLFSTLLTALMAAGLDDTLNGKCICLVVYPHSHSGLEGIGLPFGLPQSISPSIHSSRVQHVSAV